MPKQRTESCTLSRIPTVETHSRVQTVTVGDCNYMLSPDFCKETANTIRKTFVDNHLQTLMVTYLRYLH